MTNQRSDRREEFLPRLLETQEEQDRWILKNRETINAKISRGINQLDRGKGIPEDQLDAYLADLKARFIRHRHNS